MKKRLRENIEIGDEVFVPKDEYHVTVLDIMDDMALVDGPMGKEYYNLKDLEKSSSGYGERYLNESRKKVIRLTESDLTRIVKRVINEQTKSPVYVRVEKGSLVRPDGKTWKADTFPIFVNPGETLAKSFSPDCQLLVRHKNHLVRITKHPLPKNYDSLVYQSVTLPQIKPKNPTLPSGNNSVIR